jgi:hypothetical protein
MRAIATIFHSVTMLRPRPREAGRCVAAVMLAAALAVSADARAGTDGTTSVKGDALAQIAMDALSQGVSGSGAWEPRAALVGLGVAGLYLGASTAPSTRAQAKDAIRSTAARLALPMTGAALGSLVACHGPCDSHDAVFHPLIGAVAGALVAHVLDPDTRAACPTSTSGASSPGLSWTPAVTMGAGSYGVGVIGRF